LFNYSQRLSDEQLAQAQHAYDKLRGLFAARGRQPSLLGSAIERRPFNLTRTAHFRDIVVEDYRCLKQVGISNLRRVNLFLGPNNSGKTSILEAVQLLAGQSDIDELLRIVYRRGKLACDPPAEWVKDQVASRSLISGTFDNGPNGHATITILNEETPDELEDRTFYVTSLEVVAAYGPHRQHSVTHLFQQRDRITRQGSVVVLCPTVFSSPFVQHDTVFLTELFSRSVEAGTKDEVVNFIKEKLDAGFYNVDAAPSAVSAQFTRFRVTHANFEAAPDLSQFGEGVQRIFHIGLLFAYAKGGVVLIDEFENAIHYSLLRAFTKFVQELSVKFDVQVFLTSHSKECVDAFVQNNYGLEDVCAYAMRWEEGHLRAFDYPGERLEKLLEIADVDLRGGAET
jgi:ABC-type branched-subunit amino acid transport system ATPase component